MTPGADRRTASSRIGPTAVVIKLHQSKSSSDPRMNALRAETTDAPHDDVTELLGLMLV